MGGNFREPPPRSETSRRKGSHGVLGVAGPIRGVGMRPGYGEGNHYVYGELLGMSSREIKGLAEEDVI